MPAFLIGPLMRYSPLGKSIIVCEVVNTGGIVLATIAARSRIGS